jgi:uncharacterized iron-regulated membrane protein
MTSKSAPSVAQLTAQAKEATLRGDVAALKKVTDQVERHHPDLLTWFYRMFSEPAFMQAQSILRNPGKPPAVSLYQP